MRPRESWIKDFPVWTPLLATTWWLAWYFQDRFISDWDGFDYTAYTIQGLPSALGLGRALFLGYNHLLWKAARGYLGTEPDQAYLVIRYAVILMSGPAIVAVYALGKELTGSRPAAFLGALLMAASPPFIIYSGRAMSEIPGFLVLGWALWWMVRSLRRGSSTGYLAAALLAGLSANIREFAVFYLPFIALVVFLYGRNWKLGAAGIALAILGAISGIIFWTLYDPIKYWPAAINWYQLSAHEREIHPVTIRNLRFFIEFSLRCSPAVTILTPLALAWGAMTRRHRPVLLFGTVGLIADLSLIANHDLPVNPRYLLTGLPGLAVICGWCLAEVVRVFRLRSLPILLGLLILTKAGYNYSARKLYDDEWTARRAKAYISKIDHLPWNSGFIVGARAPLIHYLTGIEAHPHWSAIPPGAAWPGRKIDQAIDDMLYAGRLVYVDFDPQLWQAGVRTNNSHTADLEAIRRTFETEHMHDDFYRILRRKHIN